MRCLIRSNGTKMKVKFSFGRNASCMGERHDNVFDVYLLILVQFVEKQSSHSLINLGVSMNFSTVETG